MGLGSLFLLDEEGTVINLMTLKYELCLLSREITHRIVKDLHTRL